MTSYAPPTENVAIFDSINFTSGDEFITQSQADKRYLRFPNAQGTENLQAINVGGLATFNDAVIMNEGASILTTLADSLTIADATNSANNSDIYQLSSTLNIANRTISGEINLYASDSLGASKKSLTIEADNTIVNSNLNIYDPQLTSPNDYSIFYQQSSTLTNQYPSTNGRYVTSVNNGSGYTSIFDISRTAGSLTCDALTLTSTSGTTIQSNNISPTGTLIVKDTSTNNQTLFIPKSSAGGYNPIIPSNVQQMVSYNSTSGPNTQTLALTTQSSTTSGVIISPTSTLIGYGGTSSIPTNYFYSDSSGNTIGGITNFTSTNPPTSSQTIPASNDSSTKIPTTAWVQSAISASTPTFPANASFNSASIVPTSATTGNTAGFYNVYNLGSLYGKYYTITPVQNIIDGVTSYVDSNSVNINFSSSDPNPPTLASPLQIEIDYFFWEPISQSMGRNYMRGIIFPSFKTPNNLSVSPPTGWGMSAPTVPSPDSSYDIYNTINNQYSFFLTDPTYCPDGRQYWFYDTAYATWPAGQKGGWVGCTPSNSLQYTFKIWFRLFNANPHTILCNIRVNNANTPSSNTTINLVP